MKIAILLYTLGYGGIEKTMINLAGGLYLNKYEVDILYMNDGELSNQFNDNDIKLIKLNSNKASNCITSIKQYIKNQSPDVIISAGRHMNVILLLSVLGIKLKSKIILTEHGNPLMSEKIVSNKKGKIKVKLTNILAKILYNKADDVVCVSKSLENIIKNELNIDNTVTIYNPVIKSDMLIKGDEDISESIYINHTKPIIITVGRICDEKNHELLLEAFNEVLTYIDSELVIIGDGPLKNSIEDKVKSLNIQENVHLLGFRDNPYKYIKQSDVFVLTSKTEALPTVIIEALALGTPVISTDCQVGPREILKDGKLGILSEQNYKIVAESIIDVLNKKVHINVNEEELQCYTSEVAINKYIELINK